MFPKLGEDSISISDVIAMCDYFVITIAEFFDENPNHSGLIHEAVDELKDMDDDDILFMLRMIHRIKQ